MQEKFLDILKTNWGYDAFRPLQEEIITSVWEGNDTLGLMPTGGGKSITFQVPALAKEGICLVITPLIALMKDQVDNLRAKGIKAASVYSGMSRQQIIQTLENCIFSDYKFLYVSPERISTELFIAKLKAMNISMLVVDESHCISQWGYDFRPSYLKISTIRELLPEVPVLALTATATPEVVDDIQEKLKFKKKNVFRKSFERANLSYVARDVENKISELIHILNSIKGSAIVYVRSRKETKNISNSLREAGISSDFFHAGLTTEDKNRKQEAWKNDTCRVIVSTNAFGMGIDKSDVRVVIHLDLPNSIEEYYQEAGRAGRDEERSFAVILFNKSDISKIKKRVKDTFPERDFIIRVYEALGNYYQIAVGSGTDAIFDFDLIHFCSIFKFPSLPTHHALKILSLSGYLDYTEEVETRSLIHFLVFRDELYSLDIPTDYESLIQAILRQYSGLFSDNVAIDESLLARKIGKSREEVYEMLKTMAKWKYIQYRPKKKTPFIVYSSYREDKNLLTLPREAYLNRQKRFERRIDAMRQYVENKTTCRSKLLLLYFSEKGAKECGRCDICLTRGESRLKNYEFNEIKGAIKELLGEKKSMPISEITKKAGDHTSENVIKVIRFLIDNGELRINDDYIGITDTDSDKQK